MDRPEQRAPAPVPFLRLDREAGKPSSSGPRHRSPQSLEPPAPQSAINYHPVRAPPDPEGRWGVTALPPSAWSGGCPRQPPTLATHQPKAPPRLHSPRIPPPLPERRNLSINLPPEYV